MPSRRLDRAAKPLDIGSSGAVAALTLAVTLASVATLSGCDGVRAENIASPASGARAANASASASAANLAARGARPPAQNAPNRPCATSEISVQPARHQVIIGVDVELFTLATTGVSGCTLTGTAHLTPKGPLSPRLPGDVVDLAVSQQPIPDDLHLAAGDGRTVALTPGAHAEFYLAWFRASPVVCVQSSSFGFEVPGDSAFSDIRNVAYPLGPVCDGIFYASPVFSPSSR